jgi:transposase-like protein
LSDLAKKYEIAPKQITEWRKEFMEKSGIVFEYKETESKEIKASSHPTHHLKNLCI